MPLARATTRSEVRSRSGSKSDLRQSACIAEKWWLNAYVTARLVLSVTSCNAPHTPVTRRANGGTRSESSTLTSPPSLLHPFPSIYACSHERFL